MSFYAKGLKYARGAAFTLLLCIAYGTAPADAASLRLKWASNSEADLAGYRLRIGTFPGDYTRTIDVGKVNFYEVSDLDVGRLYYFAVVAYDWSNNESENSGEVSARISNSQTAVPRVDSAVEVGSQSMYTIPGGVRTFRVAGTNFQAGSSVRIGDSLNLGGVTLQVSGYLVGQLNLPANVPLGPRTVTVINPDLATGSRSDTLEFIRTPDITADCIVDVMDLNALARSWNETKNDAPYAAEADLDDDGYIGPDDLTIFVKYYAKAFSGCP